VPASVPRNCPFSGISGDGTVNRPFGLRQDLRWLLVSTQPVSVLEGSPQTTRKFGGSDLLLAEQALRHRDLGGTESQPCSRPVAELPGAERLALELARERAVAAGWTFRPGHGNPDVHVAERPYTKRYALSLRQLLVDLGYLAAPGRTRTHTPTRVLGRARCRAARR
jgi:hypothetical protein